MRQIKFRVWEIKKKRFLEVMLLHHFDNGVTSLTCSDGKSNVHLFEEDWILMQYTGLKDKNGKEIYEGDIVRHRKAGGIMGQGEIVIEVSRGVVVKNWPIAFDPEVIGNIHENPELLKEINNGS